MKSLFVGNMSFQTTEAELLALFSPFGKVTRAHIAMDRETGRARGFAFVEMPNDEEAKAAIAGLDGKAIGGRNLKVNEARPKEAGRGPRPSTGAPYRGGDNRGGGDNRSGGDNRGGGGNRGGGRGRDGGRGGFSNEDYREAARQPREPRW